MQEIALHLEFDKRLKKAVWLDIFTSATNGINFYIFRNLY